MSDTQAADPAPPAAPRPVDGPVRHSGAVLAVLLVAMFMAQFDFFVVNVAAPSIARDLHAGPVLVELVVAGYAFAYASGLITGGRLGDLYGHRRLYLVGMTAFALASLFCGLAQNAWQLVAARMLQGLTGALMVPQVLATITATFPPAERPRALAWFGVVGGLGSVTANLLGALLINTGVLGLGWRAIFLVNLLVAAAALAFAVRLLPPNRPSRRQGLDPVGALGIACTVGLVLVPLSVGNTEGWPAWSWACLAAALPVGAATLRWQQAQRARGGSPVLDLSLFRARGFAAGLVAGAAFLAYFAGFLFAFTQFLQVGRGYPPLHAGLIVACSAVMFSAGALSAARLVRRHGLRVVVAGGLLTVLGLALLMVQLTAFGIDTPTAGLVLAVMLIGTGNGAVLPQLIGAAMVGVRREQAGIGAGVLNTAQQFGSSAGVSIVGAVFFGIAGPVPAAGVVVGGQQHATAMAVVAAIDIGLVLLVTGVLALNARAARS
ncbi:MFS transporter [Kitasatospora sp. NPDC006697]|uniref:MFS transporter n=1 Tax=Kitasatospora sp. NPDC006697 TaxID=3364020 RepID=UPI003694E41D